MPTTIHQGSANPVLYCASLPMSKNIFWDAQHYSTFTLCLPMAFLSSYLILTSHMLNATMGMA